ncbi:hypothetical protein HYH03_002016 [Edaphochlamys debaryana]|uniref:DNA polymerase n=1 Tax=Edaphochlamys debaryana TaxID=47281 RepID=A0A835YML5_9CHLO|nr:hypothetical protein HYH03_002016 [Edaphochlamys debaryana]|eukprot:KAG2500449.1 hypothetical protein HYH03_002016 [Edaphochlamys debaryana]
MDRSRRQPAQSSATTKANAAREALKAARDGGVKRAQQFEYKEEERVYDVVDDKQYGEIVKKRRDLGDFVVDDDGAGYADLGEDDELFNGGNDAEGSDEGEGEEEDKPASKKRKKDGKGGKRKGGADGEEGKGPGGGNIAALFRKQAARGAAVTGHGGPSGPKPSDAAADQLLDSILGGLDDDAPPGPAPGPAPGLGGPRGAAPPAAPAAYGAYGRSMVPAIARPFGAYGAPYGAVPRAGMGLAAVASIGAAAGRPAAAPALKREAPAPAHAPGPAGPGSGPVEDDEPMMDMGDRDDMQDDGPGPAPGAKAEPKAEYEAGLVGVAAAADAMDADVKPPPPAAAAAARAAAPVGRNFAAEPATPADGAATHRAEDIWDEMYAAGADADGATAPSPLPDGTPAAVTPAAEASAAAAASAAGLPLDAAGVMPFYLLDAYENEQARPGEVVLIGKVEAPRPDTPAPGAAGGRGPAPPGPAWQSCAVVVRNLTRSLLVVPRPGAGVFDDSDGAISAAQAAAAADPSKKIDLLKLLQERCAPLKDELRSLLSKAGVSAMRMVPVRRSYAFEHKEVPHGEQWVLKVRYPAHMPTLPSPPSGGPPSGKTFAAAFNAQQSCLEALLLKRRIKGPCWLGVQGPSRVEHAYQSTWCKVEVVCDGSKRLLSADRGLTPDAAGRAAPPLTIASLSLKTQIHPTSHQHEIVAASVAHLSDVSPDAPLSAKEWSNPQRLRSFSIVRRLDGQTWPHGMEAAVEQLNATPRGRANGGALASLQASERALLTCLLARLQALDADVLVGHNLAAFDLTTLLSRMQHHKVPLWSRIGRIKKTEFPRLTGGGHTFGGGAGAGVMSSIAGRLLCDTYLCARELVKSVDFTLATLAHSLLGEVRSDLLAEAAAAAPGASAGAGLAALFGSSEGVLRLLRHGEGDAWLALGIMFHLSVLPLTKQLSSLSGHLWSRTLAGQRAQRIEMLLLHEFHARKYILPDKQSFKDKQRRAQAEAEDMDEDDGGGGEGDEEGGKGGGKKGKKGAAPKSNGPKYSGGLVLEPKKGLYDKIVIILDFNSLYPSIIQEYNICFTTVQRPPDGSLPPLPDPASAANGLAPLPAVLQALVQRRKQVKQAMAAERNPVTKQQLQVRQQAIKLTANSMYGCLGFGASRFYAQPLAELITAQGRSILQSTVDLVQGSIGAEVIYGDTDSIMVATRSDCVDEAKQLAARIKKEVNKRYKLLEIELDGVFRSLLLLKKKKYAAVKLEPDASGRLVEAIEQKGLDIVRRDWCPLSKDVGNFALRAVLSGRGREEVVADIHAHLREVAEKVRGGQINLGKFIITKQLTKRPEDYPDAKNQPHVQVALRRRAAGKRDGVLPGETVPYIICVERAPAAPGPDGANPAPTPAAPAAAGSLAERARHPDELREQQSLAVDVEYYLAQQVHPVVSRLVSTIEGTDAAHVADCLGLDPSRYRGQGAGAGGALGGGEEEEAGLLLGASGGTLMDEDDNFRSCAPLLLTAPSGASFPLRGVAELLQGACTPAALLAAPDAAAGDEAAAVGPAALINQVLLRSREAVARYYDGVLRADDETAEAAGGCRAVVLRPAAAAGEEAGGGGGPDRCAHPDPSRAGVLLRRALGERDLYLQLSHYHRLLHVEGAVRRHLARVRATDPKTTLTAEEVRAMVPDPLARALTAAAEAVDSLRRRSHWHWVALGRLFGGLQGAPGAGLGAEGAVGAVRGMVA